jgi:tetratricopeptide (TPR) repeat protein/O-antigen ligase
MVLLWIIIVYSQKGEIIHKTNPFEIPMFSFYIFAILSWLISLFFLNHNYPLPELLDDSVKFYKHNYLKLSMFNEGIKKLIFTLTNVLLVYLFATNYVTRKNFKKIFYTFFVVGFVASIYGILQYLGIELIWPKILNPFGGRCVSTFGNPNFLSSYLILLFPISFAYYLINKPGVWMLILMLTYFCALLATLTRSSWLGLAVSLAVFIIFLFIKQKDIFYQKQKKVVILGLLLIATFFSWPKSPIGETTPKPFQRITEIKSLVENKTYSPAHQRLMIWLCGFDMIKEKFFTGKGWGLYELFYPFYQGKYLFLEKMRSLRTHANNAHNEIIEVWAQTGTIGLGLYLLFLTILFFYAYKLIITIQNKEEKILVLALTTSVIAMLVDNLLNVTIHFCIPAFLYFFIIGCLPAFDDSRKEVKLKFNIITTTIIILIGLGIISKLVLNFVGEINYFRGFKYSRRNEFDLAVKYLSLANKFQRFEVNNNYELANAYARINEKEKAIYYYYEALASNCGYDEIHFNIAAVYSQLGNLDMAKKHYTQALVINPLSKEGYFALGGIFLSSLEKHLNDAIKLFSQAIKFYTQERDFYNNLGYLYVKKGDEKDALEYYYNALKIDPNYELARKNYLVLAQKLNLKTDPLKKYENLFARLKSLITANKFDEAEKVCFSMLEIFPNDIVAKFYLGNIYFTKKNFDLAIKIYLEIVSVNPNHLNARYNLALAYLQKNDLQNAKGQLEYILQKDPNNENIKKQLEYINSLISQGLYK